MTRRAAPAPARPGGAGRRFRIFALLLVLQAACALIFLGDIAMSALRLYPRPLAWTTREMMEIGAGIGLALGMLFGAVQVRRAYRDLHSAEQRLARASVAFGDLLQTCFDDWALTPAERDVAILAIKGLSLQEIAAIRATSEGTVRAQTTAIYRKAGVTSRPQLLALIIENLMGADLARPPQDEPERARLIS